MEVWRSIDGFDDYEVSNLGNVRSYKYNKENPRVIKGKTDKDGYRSIGLRAYNSDKQTWFQVHRLVALVFIDNPDNLETVHHINHIKDDNRVENLMWMSRADNKREDIQWRKNLTLQMA